LSLWTNPKRCLCNLEYFESDSQVSLLSGCPSVFLFFYLSTCLSFVLFVISTCQGSRPACLAISISISLAACLLFFFFSVILFSLRSSCLAICLLSSPSSIYPSIPLSLHLLVIHPFVGPLACYPCLCLSHLYPLSLKFLMA
jgi:hypothetical protein